VIRLFGVRPLPLVPALSLQDFGGRLGTTGCPLAQVGRKAVEFDVGLDGSAMLRRTPLEAHDDVVVQIVDAEVASHVVVPFEYNAGIAVGWTPADLWRRWWELFPRHIVVRTWEVGMPATREGLTSVSLGSTKEIGLRLVADGRFENLSEACRAGLRRLAEDARVIDRLAALGDEGMASGVDHAFDIDAFVEDAKASR